MEKQLEEIREQQRESWNRFSPGWRKWDDLIMDFLKPNGDEIVRLLKPKATDVILDTATGTGEPGLTLARFAENGKVILTDIAEGMLDAARDNAEKKGIRNVETLVCDVSELPFAENAFDAISCRFGYMFFPDMMLATKEMHRVLKPGGRIAASVWNVPEKNFWVTAIGGTINKHMNIPAPPPEAPGMFRCAQSGMIQDIFRQAGFRNTSETEVTGKLNCGTAHVYWDVMTEVAAPFVSALSQADNITRDNIRKEVMELVNQRYPDGNVMIEASSLVIYGEK